MSANLFPYPPPCHPDLRAPRSMDDLMPSAREAVKRTSGRGALGKAQPGDRVLIIAPPPPVQDPMVLQAVLEAFKEKGISAKAVTESEAGILSSSGGIGESFRRGWLERDLLERRKYSFASSRDQSTKAQIR